MFVLRRAALRAISQPTRQSLAVTPILRSASVQTREPLGTRTFHHSQLWLADEARKYAAEPGSMPSEGSYQFGEDKRSELADGAEKTTSTSAAGPSVGGIAEQAKDIAASAVRKTQEVVSDAVGRTTAATGRNIANDQASRNVYIGNLFYEVTSSQLESELSRFGEVVSARVILDQRGLSKGYGFVEFANSEQAQKAVEQFDQKVFQGRRMTVQLHNPRYQTDGRQERSRSKNSPSETLYIGNMSYQMSDRDLNDLFRDIRDVLDVRVAIDRRSGQPRGFAHADFANVAAAQRAKELLEQKFVYGRKLRVDFGASSNRAKEQRLGEQPDDS